MAQLVLITGVQDSMAKRLEPAFRKCGFRSEFVGSIEVAIGRATTSRYAVVVAGYPQPGDQRLIDAVRSPESRCKTSGLMLLAEPRALRDASELVGKGVNKVLAQTEEADVIACVAQRLADTRHPLAERLPSAVPVTVQVGAKQYSWRTENVSAAGLLVCAADPPEVGTRFAFKLATPSGVIEGEAKVVRHTHSDRETARGFGARFCSFQRDGRQVLASLLHKLKSERGPR